MSTPVRRPATYADLLDLPEHLVGEILDGELHASPRPGPRHALAAFELGSELGPAFSRGRGGPSGWWILFEPELHLGADVLVPDLAGWRRSRLPVIPAEPSYFSVAPDWICEVLSPSTYRIDRMKKLRIYGREGVRHAWLVHPGERTLEVLRFEGGHWAILSVHADDALVRAEPFEAAAIDLLTLWGEERAPRPRPRRTRGKRPARR